MHNIKIIESMMIYAKLVECESFTAAGEALGLSKSVVSKQITHLEQHLGVKLLNRTTRRLHMTEAGNMFYLYCQRIAREANEAQLAIGPLQNTPQGLLRIGAPQSIGMSLLPDTISKFHRKYPKVSIEIQISGRHIDLIEEGYDLALRFFHEKKRQDTSLKARKITECQFIICASPTYLQTSPPLEQPTDLIAHNALIYTQRHNSDQWLFQDKSGHTTAIKVNGNLRSNDANLLLSSALAGHGTMFGPDFMFKKYLKSQELQQILEEYYLPPSTLYAVYPNSQFVPLKIRAFIDFLVQEWKSA